MKQPQSSTVRSLRRAYPSPKVHMGHLPILQPLPSEQLPQLSPFLLLHHFGPFDVPAGVDPMNVGAHPHRGFEPVSFLFSGGLEHRDSRGNHGLLESGDVQWMTAGRGIVHSEKASPAFQDAGGVLEGIQLWVNLPASKKMMQPGYQEFRAADLGSLDRGDWRAAVVAGQLHDVTGPARTQTPLLAAMLYAQAGSTPHWNLPADWHGALYLLSGQVDVEGQSFGKGDFLQFADGTDIQVKVTEDVRGLILGGEPIDEPVVSYGPYVMNTQTEIMQAMRDYQMGKMGMITD